MSAPDAPRPTPSELRRIGQMEKFDAALRGRVFDIVREVHLPKGKVFITKFGNSARHGYVLRDRATGEQMVVGTSLLRLIHDRYLGVTLPSALEVRRRRWPDDQSTP